MVSNNRFRVTFENGRLNLLGMITDSTTFKNIDEMIRDENTINCASLEGASWNGLIRLSRFLARLKKQIRLVHIPYGVYRNLRLMPDANIAYEIDDIEVPTLNPENIIESKSLRTIGSLDLFAAAFKDEMFYEPFDGAILFGSVAHLCPLFFRDKAHAPRLTQSPWTRENIGQYTFFYDYLSFVDTNLVLAIDMVDSLESSLQHLIRDLSLNIDGCESALELLGPAYKRKQEIFNRIETLLEAINNSRQQLTTRLVSARVATESTLTRLQVAAMDSQVADVAAFYKPLEEFCQAYLTLEPLVHGIEEIGADIGSRIQVLGISQDLKSELQAVDDQAVSSVQLTQVRETLAIMDPLSEDSWEETKQLFLEQILQIDQAVFKAIILVQGFDLLRQILEHRMTEVFEVMSFLEQGGNWEETRDSIYRSITRKLVTDQEKYSCAFFLPDALDFQEKVKAEKSPEAKQSPGDVLLF